MNTRITMLLAIVALTAMLDSTARADFLAQAGFNDASGINSDPTPNSPYTIGGPVAGAGLGEPGWYGAWSGTGTVQGSTVFEGDGAVEIDPTAAIARVLAVPQTGHVAIEEYARFSPGGSMVAYTAESSMPSNNGTQAAIWQARPDNKFYVVNGIGDGGSPAPTATGFTWLPNTWYKINLDVNMVSKTWTFAVNNVPYVSPTPLGFRGNPTYLDNLNFLSEGTGPVFFDAITVVPEPSSIVLAAFGFVGLLALGWRRRNR